MTAEQTTELRPDKLNGIERYLLRLQPNAEGLDAANLDAALRLLREHREEQNAAYLAAVAEAFDRETQLTQTQAERDEVISAWHELHDEKCSGACSQHQPPGGWMPKIKSVWDELQQTKAALAEAELVLRCLYHDYVEREKQLFPKGTPFTQEEWMAGAIGQIAT